jgi:hypothetical protein
MLKGTTLLRQQVRLCSGQQVAALGSTTIGSSAGFVPGTNEEICGGLSRNYPKRSGSAGQYHKQKVQQKEQAILADSNAKMLNLGLQANPPKPPKGHRAKKQQPRVQFKAEIALSQNSLSQNGYGLYLFSGSTQIK